MSVLVAPWRPKFCRFHGGEGTVFTEMIEPHARRLELPLLVTSDFVFLFCLQFGPRVSFHCALAFLSKRGNFGRLNLGSNYSSSYGI